MLDIQIIILISLFYLYATDDTPSQRISLNLISPANMSLLIGRDGHTLHYEVLLEPLSYMSVLDEIISTSNYEICVRLNYEVSVCRSLQDIWPLNNIVMNNIVPGRRTIEMYLCRPSDGSTTHQILSSGLYIFQVVDHDINDHIPVDILAYTSETASDMNRSAVFDEVYRMSFWNFNNADIPSSGLGSTMENSQSVRHALIDIFQSTILNVMSVLDVPCGDMAWFPLVFNTRNFSLAPIVYTGADISQFVIRRNLDRLTKVRASLLDQLDSHSAALSNMDRSTIGGISFVVLDLVADNLSRTLEHVPDLIFCRHMMMHLSVDDNLAVLRNVETSGAKYFMATTFLTYDNSTNFGNHRLVTSYKINLLLPPYCLRSPLRLYKDGDAYMGLWELSADETSLMPMSC